MPANLTQQYLKAEQAYRQASTSAEELECLQSMLRELPKHKGTDKLQAELKQKISKAKAASQKGAKARGKRAAGLRIPRQGAGRAILLGGPNAGKSQLVRAMTRATPEVAPYPFTTREPTPGMMPWQDVMVQLIDTPPITKDLLDPNTLGLLRGADLAVLVVDLGCDEGIDQFQEVWERLETSKSRLARQSQLDQQDAGVTYTQTLAVLNKIDAQGAMQRRELLYELCDLDLAEFLVSGQVGTGLEPLREAIFLALDVVRVYTKQPHERKPDYDRPYTVRRGGTLFDVAELIHKDYAQHLKNARVWGSHVHDGTTVKGDYAVHDRDVVELHM